MEPCYTGIFDSHAHYDDEKFDGDRRELLALLPERGVAWVMNAAADLNSARAGIALAEAFGHVWCGVGIHPHEAAAAPADYLAQLRGLAKHPKVKAIGEIGLDYHYDFSPRETQQAVFAAQLELAAELDLPVIIHDREAHQDTMALLREYRPKGVVHCFSGSAEMAREAAELGLYLGFTGVITFKNAKKPLAALAATPPHRLLVETDAPWMAPEPFRGRRCDSSLLGYVLEAAARELGMPPQAVAELTAANARRLFGI